MGNTQIHIINRVLETLKKCELFPLKSIFWTFKTRLAVWIRVFSTKCVHSFIKPMIIHAQKTQTTASAWDNYREIYFPVFRKCNTHKLTFISTYYIFSIYDLYFFSHTKESMNHPLKINIFNLKTRLFLCSMFYPLSLSAFVLRADLKFVMDDLKISISWRRSTIFIIF